MLLAHYELSQKVDSQAKVLDNSLEHHLKFIGFVTHK